MSYITGIGASVASGAVRGAIAAGAAAKLAKPTPATIERTYQVAEDRSATWSPKLFGFIPIGSIGGSRELTLTEGNLLDNLTRDRGVLGLREFSNIADDSFAAADSRVPPATSLPAHVEARIQQLPADQQDMARASWPRNDGHNDAFRHAYWNARLTSEFGAEWTAQFTTAHEGNNPGSSTREAMDLYNNQIGRQIALDNPNASSEELGDLVMQALNEGDLVVVGRNGHLAWSDDVARNDHGMSIQLDRVPDNIQTPDGNVSAH